MKKKKSNPRKRNWRPLLYDYLLLTIGGVLLALNVNLFLAPNRIAPGGVSGISIIINHFSGFPIGIMMLILNIPMVMLGFRYLGGFTFLFRSLYVILLFNLGTDLLNFLWPAIGLSDDLLLSALYGGVLGGIGTGLVYLGRGTSGGTGILGRLLQLRTGIPLSQVYLITDGIVVVIAGLVFGWNIALYSLITLFIWGVATDHILEGPSVVRTVTIVTDRAAAVSEAIFAQMSLGLTTWQATGMFTDVSRAVLFATINRPEVKTLRSIVSEVDPGAFIVIGSGHQAYGGLLGGGLRRQSTANRGEPAGDEAANTG